MYFEENSVKLFKQPAVPAFKSRCLGQYPLSCARTSDTSWEALWCRGGSPRAAGGVSGLESSPAIDLTWELGQAEWLLLASGVSSFLQCKYKDRAKQYYPNINVSHTCSLKFSSSHIFESGRKQNIFSISKILGFPGGPSGKEPTY